MLDIATTKVYILEHKGTLYSESQINKVVKKIEKYRTTPVCDDETKAQQQKKENNKGLNSRLIQKLHYSKLKDIN